LTPRSTGDITGLVNGRRMRRVPGIMGPCRASKLICAFLLAYQFLFLNVVLPGHTRGVITLTGKSASCSLGDLGCPFCGHSGDTKKSPTHQDQSDCAICHLALRIVSEAPVDLRLTDLGLLCVAPDWRPQIPVLATPVSLPFCRGPPTCLFA
jgi:hypothetical protein